jgi:hypothetical protein
MTYFFIFGVWEKKRRQKIGFLRIFVAMLNINPTTEKRVNLGL